MTKIIALLACFFPLISQAAPKDDPAAQLKSMEAATNLGTLLASEERCEFVYDHEAIQSWIDQNVDAADMGFASTLALMSQGFEIQLSGMTDSAIAAHCRSIFRTAKHYEFIK